jgi:hexosaminidase
MKKTLILSALIAIAACSGPVVQETTLDVIPHPNAISQMEGTFNAAGASVYYGKDLDDRSKAVVKNFANQLFLTANSKGSLVEGTSAKGFVFELDVTLAHEEYIIVITKNRTLIKASGLNGFNYAIQTIKQMLPVEIFGKVPAADKDWKLPCLEIKDSPRFSYRGLHMDVSRHFFTMDEVKKYLDIMEIH